MMSKTNQLCYACLDEYWGRPKRYNHICGRQTPDRIANTKDGNKQAKHIKASGK